MKGRAWSIFCAAVCNAEPRMQYTVFMAVAFAVLAAALKIDLRTIV